MAQTFFDQMGDMNAMQMLMGLMPQLQKNPMAPAPMTFDTAPGNSIDRARSSTQQPAGPMGPAGGASDPSGMDDITKMLGGDPSQRGVGMYKSPEHALDSANDVMGMGANNPLKNIRTALDSLRSPPGGAPFPPSPPGAAPGAAGPFNTAGPPGAGTPGTPPTDPFAAAGPMFSPNSPTTTAMPPPDLQFPGGPPPASAALPPGAGPVAQPVPPPVTPPAPRAGMQPMNMDENGMPVREPSMLAAGLKSAFGLDSPDAMAGLGKGLTAAAGTSNGKFASMLRGAGATMGGTDAAERNTRKANLDERHQDETEGHNRVTEQQGNAKLFMENFMLPLRAEQMTANTDLAKKRGNSIEDGGTGGINAKNAPWKSTTFGKVVTVDDQVQKAYAEDMKTLREQGRINGWTDKQFEAATGKAKQTAEAMRQDLYRKHGLTPEQANIERTRGMTNKNPVDPFSLGLSREQFDKMVPPAKFNGTTGQWEGGWFVPKAGAQPIQRFKPMTSGEDTQKKRQNESDADRALQAGTPGATTPTDYSEAA